MTTNTKVTSKDILTANGWVTRANAYAGRCAACNAQRDAGAARIVRHPTLGMGASWALLCRSVSCTRSYLAPQLEGRGGIGDSAELIPGEVA